MTRTLAKFSCGLLIVLAMGCQAARAQKTVGPQGAEEGVIRRQSWLIPAQDRLTLMWTTVFRPPGEGPFPLAVISHGTLQSELRRAQFRRPEYPALTAWLVAHGYAVAVPQRPGHGDTGGPYYESNGSCTHPDFRKAGFNAAAAIAAAIDFMNVQKFIQRKNTIALGQSAGAWASLALAGLYPATVKAVVAFAPGLGGRADDTPGRNCAPSRLIATAREFGQKAHVPTLWLYASNDSYFGPELSQKLVAAYRMGGGEADYHLLPALSGDGHNLINAHDGAMLWQPLLEQFLRNVR